MKDGAILCQHRPLQRRDRACRRCARSPTETRQAREFVEEFTLADGRRLYLIADGRLVNLAAAEGHPAHRDGHVLREPGALGRVRRPERGLAREEGLRRAEEIDDEIARLKLATMGVDDRPAHRGAGEVPGLVGRGDLTTVEQHRSSGEPARSSCSTSAGFRTRKLELRCESAAEVAEAIRTLAVRGAPAIGVAAGVRLRARGRARRGPRRGLPSPGRVAADGGEPRLGARADAWRADTRAGLALCTSGSRSVQAHGAHTQSALFGPGTKALTHCNAGGLATGGYGSAVGALRAAWEQGLLEHVWVDETRPLLQGSRLTRVGARGARHPACGDRRLGGSAPDEPRRGRLRRHRCRPDRRERRHRQQDRHLRPGGRRRPPRASRSTSSRRPPRSTSRRRPAPRSRSRSATRAEITHALRRPEPGVRRHARGADRRDRDGGRRAPRAVRRVAAARGARMKAIILAGGYATRLQPLTDDLSKCAAARGRPADGRLGFLDSLRCGGRDRRGTLWSRTARFAPDFERWALQKDGVTVHDDGTTSNDDRARRDGRRCVHARAGRNRRRRPSSSQATISFDYSLADFTGVLAEQGRRRARSLS